MLPISLSHAEGACIRLENQSWWTIEGMECTSGFQPKEGIGRQGIVAVVKGEGNSEHITVRDNYIHDIYGMLGGSGDFTGYNSAAILVQIQGGRYLTDANRTMSDVLIEGNRIERVDKVTATVSLMILTSTASVAFASTTIVKTMLVSCS